MKEAEMATRTATKSTTDNAPVEQAKAPAPVESEASKASRVAPLDLSALSVEDAPAPKRAGVAGSGRKAQDNSVAEGWLKGSWDARAEGEKYGKGKAVTVPTEAVGTLRSRLNKAGETLNLGVTIAVEKLDDTRSRITFAAKPRRKNKAKSGE